MSDLATLPESKVRPAYWLERVAEKVGKNYPPPK